jgi:3-hydroxy-3-methylglutaryl CoA synthase
MIGNNSDLDANLIDAARNRITDFETNVTITGMALSVGRLKISSQEKAKTVVKDEEKAKLEADTYMKGLGVLETAVSDIGEGAVTNAVLVVTKLLLQNHINADSIKTFVIGTESPIGISENIAIPVIAGVNKVLDILREDDVDLGKLRPKTKLHVQEACTSQIAALANFATNGLLGGDAILVASDDAGYKIGTPAEGTGGSGAYAIHLKKSSENVDGIEISNKVGSYSKDVPDFLKIILPDTYKDSAMELVSRQPIVFGDYSKYAYSYARFMSRKDFARESGLGIAAMEPKKGRVEFPHIPYPKILDTELDYFIRHLSRSNEKLRDQLKNELKGAEEPFLNGFKNTESELKFIIELGAIYYGSVMVAKEVKGRLLERDKENLALVDDRLNTNKAFLIDGIIYDMNAIAKETKPTGDLLVALNDVTKNLEGLKHKESIVIEDLEDAFMPLYGFDKDKKPIGVISKFDEQNRLYSRAVRKTPTFESLKKILDLEKVVEISSHEGNFDTASLGMGAESYLAYAKDVAQEIIITSYGSGLSSYTLLGKTKNIERMTEKVKRNVELEMKGQKTIYNEEYTKIKKNVLKIYNDDAPLSFDTVHRSVRVNKEKLLQHLGTYIDDYRTEFCIQTVKREGAITVQETKLHIS